MRLCLKQHLFTWGDRFTVYDENGNDAYYVEGEVLTWGKKLHILSLSGEKLLFISQKVWSFRPRYELLRSGQVTACVERQFSFLQSHYLVDGFGWDVEGDFFNHEYVILAGTLQVAQVSKEWFTWGDTYTIDFIPTVRPEDVLAVVLAIDACLANN